MSLKQIAQETLSNYDPTQNPNQGFENLPDGEYDVVVKASGHKIYDSGYDCIAIDLEVVTGEYAERKELVNINIDPAAEANVKHSFIFKKNIKLIEQYAFATDTPLTEDDWEDQFTVGQALVHAVGKQCILKVEKTSPNKQGKTYTNYQFIKYPDDDEEFPF